jgi:hypothetical protein
VPLIAGFVDSDDVAIAEAALLALGASRLPKAFDLLKHKWERTAGGQLRKTLLLAIGMVRSDAGVEFLLVLLAECSPAIAKCGTSENLGASLLARNSRHPRCFGQCSDHRAVLAMRAHCTA